MANEGSWLGGLKDFSATELIGDILNIPRNYMGGSNLKGDYPLPPEYYDNLAQAEALRNQRLANEAANTGTTNTGGIQKTTTTPTQKTNNFDDIYNAMYPGWDRTAAQQDWIAKGRPGLTSTSDQLSSQRSAYDQFISANPYSDITPGWNPEDFYNELENIYQNSMNYANRQEDLARELKASNLADIEEQYGLGTSSLGQTRESSLGQLGQNTISAKQQQEEALNAARALYDELTRGSSQLFGGLSGASQYAKSIIGTEQQRQMGKTRQATADTLRNIDSQKVQVEQNYQNGLQQLQVQRNAAVREANNTLNSAISAIEKDRETAANEKALAKMNLLKEYKTQLFNIQSKAKAFEANLIQMREQANLEIDAYLKTAGLSTSAGAGLTNSLSDSLAKNKGTDLSFVTNSYNPTNQQLYTGQISKDELNKNFLQGAMTLSNPFATSNALFRK